MTDDEKTRWAVDVMTAWTQDDCRFMQQRIDTYLSEPDGNPGLITGLINLSALLLSGMEVSTGRSTQEILRAIATTISARG